MIRALPWSRPRANAVEHLPIAQEYEAQRASIEEVSFWRNAAILSMKVAAGSLIFALGSTALAIVLVEKLRGPAMAVAYFPTRDGGLQMGGTLSEQLVPNDQILAAGVRLWLTDARCLNGIASCDYQRNQAKAMTDAKSDSDPKGKLAAYFALLDKERADDPTLTRTLSHISVIPMPFVKDAPYRTFQVTWMEQAASAKGASAFIAHTGQVTIANAHPLATDSDIAQMNPNGIYVEQFSTDSDLR
jgi:type IV secretory pathway TrbF-like protein